MGPVVILMFLRPLFFWLLAVLAYWFLDSYVVNLFSGSALLTELVAASESAAKWIALVPFLMGAFLMLERLQILHEWSTEPSTGCKFCGGPQMERSGRYGPYKKCFVCQRNEKIR